MISSFSCLSFGCTSSLLKVLNGLIVIGTRCLFITQATLSDVPSVNCLIILYKSVSNASLKLMLNVFISCSCDEADSVTLTVSLDEGPRELGTFCGSKFPPAVMSANQRLDFVFVSRLRPVTSPSQPRGFNATYRFVTSAY